MKVSLRHIILRRLLAPALLCALPATLMAQAPTVTTPTVASPLPTSATLGGDVTSAGGATVTARGVVYSVTAINPNPQLLGTGVTNLSTTGTTGVFTVSATSLTPGVTYSFAAYATSNDGTGYSTVSTYSPPVVTNLTALAPTDQPVSSSSSVAIPGFAESFLTGTSNLSLTTVTLSMDASSSITTSSQPLLVYIYSNGPETPGTQIGSALTAVTSATPIAKGTYVWSYPGGLTLSASTTYWIVIKTAETTGTYNWYYDGDSGTGSGADGWTYADTSSSDTYSQLDAAGTTWTANDAQFPQLFSIVATNVATNAATNVTATGATLNGTVNASGASTAVTFNYGPTASYGYSITALPATVTGSTATAVTAALSGLVPGATYHYQVVGTNTGGTFAGGDLQFTVNAGVDYDFENNNNASFNGNTSVTISGQTWTLTGDFSVGYTPGSYGAPEPATSTPDTQAYAETPFETSEGLGDFGGLKAPTGYTFRAASFDVWPSSNSGASVYGGGNAQVGTIGLKYGLVGFKNGTAVVGSVASPIVVTDTLRTPPDSDPNNQGGWWHHIDLTGTAFATTDIDAIHFVNVAQTGTNMNYIALDNFTFFNLTSSSTFNPTINAGSAITLDENHGAYTTTLTGINDGESDGNTNVTSVTASVTGGTSTIFSAGPTVTGYSSSAGTATLGFTVASGATGVGSATITVTVTNSLNNNATATYNVTVNPAVVAATAIASTSLTQNHAATSFTPVTGSGGTAPLSYSVSPLLPTGLSFNASTGAITGTASVTSSATNYTVTVTDATSSTATANFSLTVNPAVTATQSVPSTSLTQNQAVTSFTPVTGSGGTGSLTYGISPTLPTGLSISASTGAITGTPSGTSSATTYTVTITDANGATATNTFSLTVNPLADLGVTIVASPAPSVMAGNNLTYTIVVENYGPSSAATCQLALPMPGGTTLVSTTVASGWTEADSVAVGSNGILTFSDPSLTSEAFSTFTIVVKVAANVAVSTQLSTTATVSTATTEPTPDTTHPDSATATTSVAASNDDTLLGLAVSPVALSPNFATATLNYADFVPTGTTSVMVTPTLNNANASVTVNGVAASSGSPSAVTVSPGYNQIPVVVTAQNNSTKQTYTIDVVVPAPGVLDGSFAPALTADPNNPGVMAVAVQSDGKILVGGGILASDNMSDEVVRLNTDGTVDNTFTMPLFDQVVECITVQPDGKILVGGEFTMVNGNNALSGFARLNADGSVDSTFNPPALVGTVSTIALQSTGAVIVGGNFESIGASETNSIARFSSTGVFDPNFVVGSGPQGVIYSLVVDPSDNILVGGQFTAFQDSVNYYVVEGFVRLNAADGTVDTTFNSGGAGVTGNADVFAMALQKDGSILLAGDFNNVNGTSISGVARLSSSGVVDKTFNPGTFVGQSVNSIAVQTDGNIVLGGLFNSFGGTTANNVVRLTTTGSVDTTFNAGGGPYSVNGGGLVDALALQADGHVLIGGVIDTVNGISQPLIARLDNGAATETLSAASSSSISWQLSGTGPELVTVEFYLSTNGGITYSPLGAGTRVTGGWSISSLSLPGSGMIEALGNSSSGGSKSLIGPSESYTLPPTITMSTANLASTAPTLVINGTGFDGTTASNNTVALSSGTATVTQATSTSLTLTFTTQPSVGALSAIVTADGLSSPLTQVATVYTPVAPTITSLSEATFALEQSGVFTVTTTGTPTPSLTAGSGVPAWLTFTDNGNGTATLTGTPPSGSTGSYPFTITASNGASPNYVQNFTLYVGTVNPTAVQVGTSGTLNKQTGLYQLTVNVTNTTAAAINGFRLFVDYSAYLPSYPTLKLYNASSDPGATPVYVDYPYPVAVGATVPMTLDFYTSNRVMPNPFTPNFTVTALSTSEVPNTNETGTPVTRIVKLADKTVLIEWNSIATHWYRVSYSSDMHTWYDSPTPLQAGSNQMQWIDNGAPLTSISPADPSVTSRFYIVNQIATP